MTNALNCAGNIADPQALRRRIYAQPNVSRANLTDLLALSGEADSQEHAALLADVATDLLVNQVDPPKYISQADADWLTNAVRACSGLSMRAEIRMLTDVIRYAVSVPPSLAGFCVSEIESAIIKGRADHPAGAVSEADLEALREAAFAAVEGSALHVTRHSAEALFRIAHATNGAANAPGFDEFFAKAVGNYLMGIAFHWTPSAAAEREKEQWLDQKPESLEQFVAEEFGGSAPLRLDLRSPTQIDEERIKAENAADQSEMAMASQIDPGETDWLTAQLSRSGALTSAERSLLQFLRREAPALPARLQARIEELAA